MFSCYERAISVLASPHLRATNRYVTAFQPLSLSFAELSRAVKQGCETPPTNAQLLILPRTSSYILHTVLR